MSAAISSKRWLDPQTRVAEVLFGLIMVLTFTGSLSVAEAGAEDVREMLIGALGCNIAWGVIDAIFYLMDCISEQGKGIRALRALRKAKTPAEGHRVITESMPALVAGSMTATELEPVRQKLLQLPDPPVRPRLGKEEWLGGFMVFFWVFVTTFPVTIPFMFMEEIGPAMRASNAIAIAMLFIAGYAFARIAEYRPLLTGLLMVVIGSGVVSATIALGG
jgi:hypothetical protein